MIIGIFSKLGASGGSEHRAAEIANGIVRFSEHECWILCEKEFSSRVSERLDKKVRVIERIFLPLKNDKYDSPNPSPYPDHSFLYDIDSLLILNTDSYSFARIEYWEGKKVWKDKPPRHSYFVDVSKIPQMVFLFNFIIKPSRWVYSIAEKCKDVRIICANHDYDREIRKNDKYEKVRNLKKMILNSPIDLDYISIKKTKSDFIRIGRHSKPFGYKYDEECTELIKRINKKYKDKIKWDFMGVSDEAKKDLKSIDNVMVRPEYSISVKDYLENIDIFLFFIKWSRNEPWARVVAEGMAAGCPILATNKAGNKDQVKNNKSGYLCSSLGEFEEKLSYLIENPEKIKEMGKKSRRIARNFSTEKIIEKYLDFIK